MTLREFARKVFGGQWPILLPGVILIAAFALVIAGYWRRGALVLAIGVAVAAAGVPHMVTAEMVRKGAAVIDVGVSRDDAGKLVGDVHPDVWDVAGHVSPNPGGVGPLTRAFLLTNVVERAETLAGA